MFRSFKKSNLPYFIVPLVCLLFYLGLVKHGHKELDLAPHINYFRHLADAFLHGRLNIINPPTGWDLVEYDQKLYIYWPPVPALVFMPLVALFGTELPDALISSLFGIANIWLIMKICNALSKKFALGLSPATIVWVGLFWGLGTVHFYMAKEGSVWFISQIMAQTFLFSAVYVILTNKEKYSALILSGLFFAMAAYTRNHLVFSVFFFLFLYAAIHPPLKFREWLKRGWVFITPFIIFSLLNCWYNYARFGNIFENGIKYHDMNPYFLENFKQHGYFSLYYFPHNFFIEVLHFPTLIPHYPFIQEEAEGFGFIWGSPLYLLLLPALLLFSRNLLLKKTVDGNLNLVSIGCMAATVPIAFVIFSIMGTGWYQFCARYTLDFQFFLIVFLLFLWKDLKVIPSIKHIAIGLILISIIVQYIGASFMSL